METEKELRCPICGAWLDEDDVVYVEESGRVLGCQNCIHEEYGWQQAGRSQSDFSEQEAYGAHQSA